jgi:hypothetical protein
MPKPVPGCVNIANDVLADLAGYAALESYGIVGMASPSLRDGVAQLLPAQKLRKGVHVVSTDDGIVADLYVVIEFGTNLAEVSHNSRTVCATCSRTRRTYRWPTSTSTCRASKSAPYDASHLGADDMTASRYLNLIGGAAQALKDRKEEVNRLNVFPVPDGDTGTNMSLTMDVVVSRGRQAGRGRRHPDSLPRDHSRVA